eukprot:gene17730-19502_t
MSNGHWPVLLLAVPTKEYYTIYDLSLSHLSKLVTCNCPCLPTKTRLLAIVTNKHPAHFFNRVFSDTRKKQTASLAVAVGYLQKMLPDEVLLKLCSYCAPLELCRLAVTCKRLNALCKDDSLWKSLYERVYRFKLPILKGSNRLYESANKSASCLGLTWKAAFPLFAKAYHVTKNDKVFRDLTYMQRRKAPFWCILDLQRGNHAGEEFSIVGTEDAITKELPTVTCSNGSIFRLRPTATGSTLAYLRLEAAASETGNQSRGHCIEICNDCTPIIQDCFITSKNSSELVCCVCAWRWRKAEGCEVQNCGLRERGNIPDRRAQGTYEENEVCNNRLAGFWVKGNANPVVRRNVIHHGRDAGLFMFDGGLGYFEENNVHSNRIAGFEIRSGANPTVVRCQIYGSWRVYSNKIHSNTFAGVWITSGSNPTIKDNEIYHGQQGGIYVFGDGRGLIENNDIHGNALAGIQISTKEVSVSSKTMNLLQYFSRNLDNYRQLSNSEAQQDTQWQTEARTSVDVVRASCACNWYYMQQCAVYVNLCMSALENDECNDALHTRRIPVANKVGVYFYDKGCGTLEDNEIYNHKYSGIQIRSGSNPVIRKNKIWGGKNEVCLFTMEDLASLRIMRSSTMLWPAWWIKTESNPILRRIKFTMATKEEFAYSITERAGAAGIEITNSAGGVLEKNEIFNNRFDGVSLATGVSPKMLDNFCHDNKKVLTEAVNAGKCLFQVSGNLCYPMHDFYKCKTCASTENLAICVNCIRTCHQGTMFNSSDTTGFFAIAELAQQPRHVAWPI